MMLIRLLVLVLGIALFVSSVACTPSLPADNQNDNRGQDDDDDDDDDDMDDDDDDDVLGDIVGFVLASVSRSLDTLGDQTSTTASAFFSTTDDADDDGNVEQKTIGACLVTTTTLNPGDVDVPNQSPLDPGAPGMVSNSTYEATLNQIAAGTYVGPVDLAALGFSGGQRWTFSFPGGADIAGFTGAIDIPGSVTVSSPDLADPNLAIDTTAALPVAWNADGTAESAVITVSTATTTQFVAISCSVGDTGIFTVPQAAMACLLSNSTITSVSVQLMNLETVTVSRVGGGTASVQLSAVSGVTRTIIPAANLPGGDLPGGGFNPCDFIPCPEGTTCNPATFMCE